ncbi:hypothetical protein BFP70_00985 [Thioclava sp. SK-1]|uniref:hypothetical protein n=1 Tax=Thioclava sp. SK-1 TaxID=1889770 RepID=UPI0008262418|nr:hypothetical protein [Thioclava sp. SK-1]OCX66763.1 hypothetical protein BFP70_00985 [Thioclava sp. SK-1]
MLTRVSVIAASVLLVGCAPPEPELAPTPNLPTPYMTPETSTTDSGLVEREPDLCHAKEYVTALGQPETVIPSLGLGDRPYRVVEWRGVEDQIYTPHRVVFRLDQYGNIYNIDCG